MTLLAIGISHHTAPVEIREQVAINPADYSDRIRQLLRIQGIEEAIILGTCNRTEIYCFTSQPVQQELLSWLHETNSVPPGQLDPHFYLHAGKDVVRHLVRVAGGLDSMVLGEAQILGQLKEAWQISQEAGGAGRVLDRLFQSTFSAAKSIRHSSGIGNHPVSVAYTAVILARQIFGDLSSQNVVLIGAGEMIRLCGKHLREQGIARLEIVNRSLSAAQDLAAELDATASALDMLSEVLPRADILISSTASPHAIIKLAAVKAALKKRRHRPMFMVDIAVPRDVDPAVKELDDVYLYTIDDLQQVVDENMQQRHLAASGAMADVDLSADAFMRWLHGIRASGSLQRIRSQSHVRESTLIEKALKQLQAGQDPQQVLTQLTSTLTNQILHEPTVRLRQAAEEQHYEILKAADWIFGTREDWES
jgi:glutamyl-tRNA reductase